MFEIELIRVALGTLNRLSRVPSMKEWSDLYAFANKHSIQGLYFGGIERLPAIQRPCKDLCLKWFGQSLLQKNRKILFDCTMAQLAKLFLNEKINFVVFKGLAVASKYPDPELRTMGDIDFYVPPSDFDRAVEIVERKLCQINEKDFVDKHFAFEMNGVRLEMHYRMETFGSCRHQRYFGTLVDDAIMNQLPRFNSSSIKIPMLPAELDLILVFKHWMSHLLGEGIGLRQTTDIAILISTYKNQIKVKELKTHLSNIGYRRAFDAIVMMVEKYYAITWPEYWMTGDKKNYLNRDELIRYADLLMAEIMRNGNFGRSDYQYREGFAKRLETTKRFFHHCIKYFKLAPIEIMFLIPKRIFISLKTH